MMQQENCGITNSSVRRNSIHMANDFIFWGCLLMTGGLVLIKKSAEWYTS